MTTKEKYILAYRLLRYCGDFETFNSLCANYGIEHSIRNQAYRSYHQSQYIDEIGEAYRNQVFITRIRNKIRKVDLIGWWNYAK